MKIADDVKIPVSLIGIQPEMSAAFPMIESVFVGMGYEAILTSGTEGEHKIGSLHPKGLATDWRSRHIREDLKQVVLVRLQKALQKQFQVLLEKNPEHFHIEFDPK